jgi:Gpi18-like mannosyltransferase
MKKKATLFVFKIDRFLIIYLLLFCVYVSLIPRSGHGWDMWCWQEWAKNVFANGFKGVYRTYEFTTDYPPLFHYFLYAFGIFQGSVENIVKNLHYIKIIPLTFDFLGGVYLTKLIRDRYKDSNDIFFYSLLLFLNIAYFYNSIIWGQVDGMMTAFIFIACYYAIKNKVLYSLVFFLIALNLKLQAIIFLPVLGLILIPAFIKDFSLPKLFMWLAIPVSIQLLILWPFLGTEAMDKIWYITVNSVGRYSEVSMNAYNIWYWLIDGDLKTVHDTGTYWHISYRHWGLGMFFIMSFIALLPLLIDIYTILFRKKESGISLNKIFLTAALIPLIFFFFNTEMHERYSHPSLLFVAAYSILTKRFLPYIFVSVAYLLNLEGVLRYLQLRNYSTVIFDPRFVAGIFFITICMLFWDLYKPLKVPTRV